MSDNITQNLRNSFDLASLQQEFKTMRKGTDFEKGTEIMKRHSLERRQIEKTYYTQYDCRVEQALKRLIDKAGGKQKTFTQRFMGADKFDKSTLLRQAHRDVQFDHKRRMRLSHNSEKSELQALSSSINKRDGLRDTVKTDFARSSDRRSGSERRQAPAPSLPKRNR